MALPSVRVVRIHFSEGCQSSCDKSNFKNNDGCKKGEIIMSLNFTPVSYILSKTYIAPPQNFVITFKKEKIYYHKNIISKYQNYIWQPPKIIS